MWCCRFNGQISNYYFIRWCSCIHYNGINLDDSELTRGFNFELHHEGKFLHFRNACGWDNQFITNDSDKTNVLFHMISDFMEAK